MVNQTQKYVQPAPPPAPEQPVENQRNLLELFVGGFGDETTGEDIYDYFVQFGQITKFKFFGTRRFGFLAFKNPYVTKRMLQMKHTTPKTNFSVRIAGDGQPNFFVGRLSPSISNVEIENYFSQFGSCRFDRIDNHLYGFMYIDVEKKDHQKVLGNHTISGITVDVKVKLSRQQVYKEKSSGKLPGRASDTCTENALFIGNVDTEMTREDFHKYFQQFGECQTHLKMHLNGTKNRGFGFINFESLPVRDSLLNKNPTPFLIRPSHGRKTRREFIAHKKQQEQKYTPAGGKPTLMAKIPGIIVEHAGQHYIINLSQEQNAPYVPIQYGTTNPTTVKQYPPAPAAPYYAVPAPLQQQQYQQPQQYQQYQQPQQYQQQPQQPLIIKNDPPQPFYGPLSQNQTRPYISQKENECPMMQQKQNIQHTSENVKPFQNYTSKTQNVVISHKSPTRVPRKSPPPAPKLKQIYHRERAAFGQITNHCSNGNIGNQLKFSPY